jgi:hypothetical protein
LSISTLYYGNYVRKVNDLPEPVKSVILEIISREYTCDNNECDAVTAAKTYQGFLNHIAI